MSKNMVCLETAAIGAVEQPDRTFALVDKTGKILKSGFVSDHDAIDYLNKQTNCKKYFEGVER